MKVQVAIIGGGPAGMLLSEILSQHHIDNIVLEKRSREHVLSRIRAGVLEQSTVNLLTTYGLGDRMLKEGKSRDGFKLIWGNNNRLSMNLAALTGKGLMTYGQAEIQKDLYSAADKRHAIIHFDVNQVTLHHLDSTKPTVTYLHQGNHKRIDCDFIAGCDGFHGVSRQSIPASALAIYEKCYPFSWLGVLSPTPPLPDITYVNHARGFALASSRNPMLSRYYIQVPNESHIATWSDDRFWSELKQRFPRDLSEAIQTGPSIEKSITRLRCHLIEPLRYGRLFLAGDAAHLLPPTGAKGLNQAVSDVFYLSHALIAHYRLGSMQLLDSYSNTALHRIRHSMHLSTHMTNLLHRWPEGSEYDQHKQASALATLHYSLDAQLSLAQQYAGLAL